MAHYNDPRSLGTVNAGEIVGQPVILLIRSVNFIATIDSSKWSTVSNICFVFRGVGLISRKISYEGVLRAVGKIRFTIDRDKMSEAIVKRIPEVAHTARLVSWHSEAILISGKVSGTIRSLS